MIPAPFLLDSFVMKLPLCLVLPAPHATTSVSSITLRIVSPAPYRLTSATLTHEFPTSVLPAPLR